MKADLTALFLPRQPAMPLTEVRHSPVLDHFDCVKNATVILLLLLLLTCVGGAADGGVERGPGWYGRICLGGKEVCSPA